MSNNAIQRKFMKILLFLGLALGFLSACATAPKMGTNPTTPVVDHFSEVNNLSIPLVMNDRVQDWIDYFQGAGRSHFELYLRRSGKYIPMMKKILRQQGLPEDLVYLSMIESGFNPHAYSRARATGAWQFIYQTGQRYGLAADNWVDERRDPEKSTIAAAKYLKDLYDRHNNWYLAAASYNAGEGKIDRAIKKYDTEDFWELTHGRYLKAETKAYVPKLIAAALIAKNPKKYGFTDIEYEDPIIFDEVVVQGPLDLRVAAKCAEVSYEDIKVLNPELLHWVTPLLRREYQLKIPKGSREKFSKNYSELASEDQLGDEKVTVTKTATVERLARKHRVPAVLLAAANGLSTRDTVRTGHSIVVPFDPPAGETFREKNYMTSYKGKRHIHASRHHYTRKVLARTEHVEKSSGRHHKKAVKAKRSHHIQASKKHPVNAVALENN